MLSWHKYETDPQVRCLPIPTPPLARPRLCCALDDGLPVEPFQPQHAESACCSRTAVKGGERR